MLTITSKNGYPINLVECAGGFYAVTYGARCDKDLNAEQAYNALQSALLHALALEGLFDED